MIDGFRIFKKPIKYQTTKDDLRQAFFGLSKIEFMVYCAYKCYSLREIARTIKLSHSSVSRIYKRACEKLADNPPKR